MESAGIIDIRPTIHAMHYGDSGTGKSTFASTYPKNMLVWMFDPLGKDMPYRKGALTDTGILSYELGGPHGAITIPYRDVTHEDGLTRIEYYHDADPEQPDAYTRYRFRMAVFQQEYATWQTVVADSVTFMELLARKVEEKILNPMVKFAKGTDTRQWFSGSTDALEEMVVMRYAGLPMNVVIVCHVDERRNDVSGEILKGASAPGRLAKRGLLNAAFQEQYYVYTMRDSVGVRHHQVQTQNRDGFAATTQINAPDPCYPGYDSLWAGWGK